MRKKFLAAAVAMTMALSAVLTGCGGGSASDEVILYTNADDEAIEAMKSTLDENGYSGQYIVQSFGTSELGGKLLAEGTNIEADLVTMSSFYLDSAQEQQSMFKDLTFETNAMDEYPSFYTPITAQEGAILLNTEMMAECIITKGRAKLQEYYPLPIYEGETADSAYMSANPKVYPEPLTVDLLEKHQQISEKAKELAGK